MTEPGQPGQFSLWADSAVVFWKELREGLRGGTGRSRWGMVAIVGYFGVALPLLFGVPSRRPVGGPSQESFLVSVVEIVPLLIGLLAIMLLYPGAIVADAVAGERERRTLETLLATRLPTRAILAGKLLAAITIGVALGWACLALNVLVTMVAHGVTLPLVRPAVLGGLLVGSVVLATLEASLAAVVSVYAKSQRQAQQLSSLLFLAVSFIPFLFFQLVPHSLQVRVINWLSGLPLGQMVAVVGVGLIVLDLVILTVAFAVFQRDRLLRD